MDNKQNNIELRVMAKQIKGEKDGKKYDFIAFSSNEKNGNIFKLKFRKDVYGLPNKEGLYKFIIAEDKLNKNKNNVYNEFWCKGFITWELYNIDKNVDKEVIKEYVDDKITDDEDLPF